MEDYIDEVVENTADSKTESKSENGGFNSWPIYTTISMGFVGMGRETSPLMFIPAAGFGLAGAYDFLKKTGYDPRVIVNAIYQMILGKN